MRQRLRQRFPQSRHGRRTAAGGGCLLLTVALTGGVLGPAGPAEASPAAPAANLPLQVVVNTFKAADAKGEVLVNGEVVNPSGKSYNDVQVGLKVRSRAVKSRSEIAELEHSPVPDQTVTGSGSTGKFEVPANGRKGWELKVKAEDLNKFLKVAGVFPAALEATAGDGNRVGLTRTVLPWATAQTFKDTPPVSVATLWPLVDRPHRDGTTIGDDAQTPVFTDDELTKDFDIVNGRLSKLVKEGTGLNVTWVVDPDLLDSAASMRDGYRVVRPGSEEPRGEPAEPDEELKVTPRTVNNTDTGGGGGLAANWLTNLKIISRDGQVVALPYGDLDVAAVAHSPKADLTPLLKSAGARGTDTAQALLGRPVDGGIVWPVEGAVDDAVLATAKASDARSVIVSGSSVPLTRDLNYTPSARTELSGAVPGLVGDAEIAKLLAADLSAPGARALTAQKLLAELLMTALEQPSKPRTLLITPPRRMSADTAEVLSSVLKQSGVWAKQVPLDELATAPLDPNAKRKPGPYPKDLRATEPSATYLKQIPALEESLSVFSAILSSPDRVQRPFGPAVERTMSTAWRGRPDEAEDYRVSVTRSLRDVEQLVRIIRKRGVTISGDKGNIPITVVNDLKQPVKVRVEVTSKQPNRLKIKNPVQNVEVGEGKKPAVRFEAEAAANGKVLVEVKMFTPDGRQVGQTQTFFVNTTSIDTITMVVIGVIAVLLLIFSVRAFLLRRRRAAEEGGQTIPDSEDTSPGDPPGGGVDEKVSPTDRQRSR